MPASDVHPDSAPHGSGAPSTRRLPRPPGVHHIERGTGFTVESAGCPVAAARLPGVKLDYYMQVFVRHQNLVGSSVFSLAASLRPGDPPVRIGAWFDTDWLVPTLVTRVFRRNCTVQGCSQPSMIGEKTYPLTVREPGEGCAADYDAAGGCLITPNGHTCWLDVNDQQPSPGPYRTAHVTSHGYSLVDPAAQVEAEAYAADGSRDVVTVQGFGSPFAVYTDDFYPVMPLPAGYFGALTAQAARTQTGVPHAAGLRWPRVVGQRNGLPYRYSCRVPRVVRDVVDFCPALTTHGFYRLPFALGVRWTQGPANGQGSHTGAAHYSYDMFRGCGADVRAMRSGLVINAVTGFDCQSPSNWDNCSDDPAEPKCGSLCCNRALCDVEQKPEQCKGNLVMIRHQDGSLGVYRHLRPGSVAVSTGEVVRRGQLIGTMGTTGNAGGVHLHTGARNPYDETQTTPIRFQMLLPLVSDPPLAKPCYDP